MTHLFVLSRPTRCLLNVTALLLVAMLSSHALADASEPAADLPGALDSPVVGRFAGSYIVAYYQMDFDELSLPLSPLSAVEGARDAKNNRVYQPEESMDIEGARTRLVYLMPANVSPLQAVRNYQTLLATSDGKVRFECKADECGGDTNRSAGGGGGRQSLAMFLWPEDRVLEEAFSNAHCAQTERITDQRYTVVELPTGSFVSVLAYTLQDDGYCKAFNGRTIVAVDILEVRDMGHSMVVIEPEEMDRSIKESGAVTLYGIYFDSGTAQLKSESSKTLEGVARLLDEGNLKLLVVGHTDSQGGFDSNRQLSEQRAAAVVEALVERYGVERERLTPVGVSYAAPRASNATEEGRALNRRVELVAK